MTRELTDSERLVALEVKLDAVHGDIHAIWESINRLSGRPSWSVSIVMTLLSSMVVGLAVALGAQIGT